MRERATPVLALSTLNGAGVYIYLLVGVVLAGHAGYANFDDREEAIGFVQMRRRDAGLLRKRYASIGRSTCL